MCVYFCVVYLNKCSRMQLKDYFHRFYWSLVLKTKVCSSLNMDLFHKNITESPLCQCGSIEDTQHYFFHCRFYQGPRNTLLNACTTYQNPSLSLLLFGSSTLSLEANIAILEHVHKYILDTKRFT